MVKHKVNTPGGELPIGAAIWAAIESHKKAIRKERLCSRRAVSSIPLKKAKPSKNFTRFPNVWFRR